MDIYKNYNKKVFHSKTYLELIHDCNCQTHFITVNKTFTKVKTFLSVFRTINLLLIPQVLYVKEIL